MVGVIMLDAEIDGLVTNLMMSGVAVVSRVGTGSHAADFVDAWRQFGG